MTDKKKPASAPTEDKAPESDRQFLERTGVNDEIKAVLTSMIENRPINPISFLADYFSSLEKNSSTVLKAYSQLCLTHHTRPIFDLNLRKAFDTLTQTRLTRSLKGLNGKVFMELLEMICRPLPTAIAEKLLPKLQTRDHEAVTYNSFKTCVFTCFVLQDFVRLSEELYLSLDILHTDKADKCLCETTLLQLKNAVTMSDSSCAPDSIIEAGYSLAPDKIYTAFNKAVSSHRGNQQFMNKEEFIQAAAESFLNRVPKQR